MCFSCSIMMPPWLCMIGFGRPVVPEENRIHSGCVERHLLELECVAAGTGDRRAASYQSSASGVSGVAIGRIQIRQRGSRARAWAAAPMISRTSARRSNGLPPYW